MTQHEWDPMRELAGVQQRMNRLFESAMTRTNFDLEGGAGSWSPAAEAFETADRFVACVELPGLSRSDIDVRVDEGDLVVQGERRPDPEVPGEQYHRIERSHGKFARRFPLPSDADREGVEASYRDGVLRVVVPRRGTAESRSIRVSVR